MPLKKKPDQTNCRQISLLCMVLLYISRQILYEVVTSEICSDSDTLRSLLGRNQPDH